MVLLRRSSSIAVVLRWVGFVLRVRRGRGSSLLVVVLVRYIVVIASGRQYRSVEFGCVCHFEGIAVRMGCHMRLIRMAWLQSRASHRLLRALRQAEGGMACSACMLSSQKADVGVAACQRRMASTLRKAKAKKKFVAVSNEMDDRGFCLIKLKRVFRTGSRERSVYRNAGRILDQSTRDEGPVCCECRARQARVDSARLC